MSFTPFDPDMAAPSPCHAPAAVGVSCGHLNGVPSIYVVEGNIGVGKSTITARLAGLLNAQLYSEPVARNPYLERFYADPCRWAFKLQMWILRQRFCTYVAALSHMLRTGQSVILDRSVFSDIVFARNSYEEGQMTVQEYAFYLLARQTLTEFLPPPTSVLFLDAEPEVCHRRITWLRCRPCESTIPITYLRGLHNNYKRWLRDIRQHCPVVCLDWSEFRPAYELVPVLTANPPAMLPEPARRAEMLELLCDVDALQAVMTVDLTDATTCARAVEILRMLDASSGCPQTDLVAIRAVNDLGPGPIDQADTGLITGDALERIAAGHTR